jgi:hypothetical protein
VPKLRGDNILYPSRDGRAFRKKTADSRVITLAMWVAGIDPATDQPSENEKVQFNDNWKTLQELFWSPTEQLTLTRRWWENKSSPVLRTATAKCELAGTLDPTMTGRTRADFAVDLLLADPYFYGTELTVNLEPGVPVVVNNPGDIPIYSTITMEFNGELISPTITNSTADPEVFMTLNTAVVADEVLVDVGKFSVVNTFDNGSLVGSVTHSGSRHWMMLEKGNNTLELTSLGNSTGDVVLKYKPAYL